MNKEIENLNEALKRAMTNRPKVGGFPHLAEVLRQAGVIKNTWHLPSCQSFYLTKLGAVITQGSPLVEGMTIVPPFDEMALVRALRIDQAGNSTLPEFLLASWKAGVISYDVDFEKHECTYYGSLGECYVESYPVVELLT